MKMIFILLFFAFVSCSMAVRSQSTETFNSIRFEDPSSIGSFITINPPSGISPYSLTLPASLSAGTWGFRVNGSTGTMTWGPIYTFSGADKQLAWFKGTDTLKGSSNLLWDDALMQLTLNNSGTITSSDTVFKITNSVSSSTAGIGKVGMMISSTGAMSGVNTTNTALILDARGASSNNAVVFLNGRVGIGTSTPNTMLDVTEDVAYRELNFTTTLSATANDVAFNTGNKAAFVRVAGSQTTDFTITGIASGSNGKIMTLYNVTGKTMTLSHENTSSSAANRIVTPTSGNVLVGNKSCVTLQYSNAESRWIMIGSAGTSGMGTNSEIAKTITATDKVLPSDDYNYIRVTNNSGTLTPTLNDGTYIGQTLIIQNNGANNLTIANTTNIACDGGTITLGVKDVVSFVWDGSKWYQSAQLSNN